jgi:hypothetical protein
MDWHINLHNNIHADSLVVAKYMARHNLLSHYSPNGIGIFAQDQNSKALHEKGQSANGKIQRPDE